MMPREFLDARAPGRSGRVVLFVISHPALAAPRTSC